MKEKIFEMLKNENVKFVHFEHEASGPSNLSKDIRSKHGYPNAVGAKALILSCNFRVEENGENKTEKKNVLVVLPGHKQLDKIKLKNVVKNLKDFRFATSEELLDLTGLVPGSVPPLGKPILNIDLFILDKSLENEKELGFNAGSLTHSVVLDATEYFKAVKPDILDFVS